MNSIENNKSDFLNKNICLAFFLLAYSLFTGWLIVDDVFLI